MNVQIINEKKNNCKISVILSFYNEQDVIPELIKRLRKVFGDLVAQNIIGSYELIFVNDNSTDLSENILRSELNFGHLIIINMSRNFGVSECVMAGLENSVGNAVIYMDADLQDPPEIIPIMINAWLEDLDTEVVYTTRIRRNGEHWLKLVITKIGYRLINKISDIPLEIDSGDFKLLSRKIVNLLLKMKEDKPYLRGLVSWTGFKQTQVYYTREERFNGRENTKMNVLSKKVIYYWLDRALISFSDAPLKFTLLLGITLSLISFSYILIVIIQKILGLSVPGWTAIMSAVLFLGGAQMMMLGFIGLYIGAIFRETKGRPRYIIKEILKKE